MLIIHHAEGRRSERVAWLCEELDLPYELRFFSGDVSKSIGTLSEVHPMRMAPILEDGTLRLVESGAILEYILSRYGGGRFRPDDASDDFVQYLQWMHFAEGSGMLRGMIEQMILRLAGEGAPPDVKYIYIGASARVLRFAETALSRTGYFAGEEFSAADIMMHFPLRLASLAAQGIATVKPLFHCDRSGLAEYPNIDRFLDRMAERPAFQRAMATTMPNGPPPF